MSKESELKREPIQEQLVANPNETWGQFFRSMIEFREPQLVPVNSLPPEQRPENRSLQGIRYLVNWRGQNFHETWQPVSQSATFPDHEQNAL